MTDSLKISPKVLIQGLVTIVGVVVVAVIGYLLTPAGAALYDTWHPLAVVAVQALLPALLGALAGYLKPDPLRDAGEVAVHERATQSVADYKAAVESSGARRAAQPELPAQPAYEGESLEEYERRNA